MEKTCCWHENDAAAAELENFDPVVESELVIAGVVALRPDSYLFLVLSAT